MNNVTLLNILVIAIMILFFAVWYAIMSAIVKNGVKSALKDRYLQEGNACHNSLWCLSRYVYV